MSYTALAVIAVGLSFILDLVIVKTRLIRLKAFWTAYTIILPFQLLTNWWLTSRNIVMYDRARIIGIRIASAPLEDLFFGFSLILAVLVLWVHQKRKN